MRSATVFVKERPAGIISRFRNGSYEFRYLPRYRADRGLPSVAFTLSKKRAVYRSEVLFPFFYGLLAEGSQKRSQCRALRIDERDHYTRLLETCREGVIGAVYVRPRRQN